MSAQGRKLHKEFGQQYTKIQATKRTCSKMSAVVAMANYQQKKQNKSLQISERNRKRKALAKL
jgi:hypothetical protein